MTNEQVARFFSKVTIPRYLGCWEWGAQLNVSGYGVVKIGGNPQMAHRVSYKFFHGDIPDGMSVCHKCDNPVCINPKHLFLGTHQDNMDDMYKKGRHGGAKISLAHKSKMFCKNGHEYTDENTRIRPNGHRVCRACSRKNDKKSYQKHKRRICEEQRQKRLARRVYE